MKRGLFAASASLALASAAFGVGPDVTYAEPGGYVNYGLVGTTRAYYLGSYTCNTCNQTLAWVSNGTPVLFTEMYRLYDGRLEMLGMSFGKHACCAGSGSWAACGTCNTGSPGTGLKAGCRDVYSASYNGSQGRLGPRSNINAFLGTTTGPGTTTDTSVIGERLQVSQSDLLATGFPGARYFVEGTYVSTDDAAAGNSLNNCTYQPVNINQSTFDLTSGGGAVMGKPAIFAWREHGLGPNQPDPSVTIVPVDVPGEGRFFVGSKVRDLGNGMYRYDYAVFNVNSHVSGESLRIPLPVSAALENVGFHDVNYHSGEPYNSADWNFVRASDTIRWESPEKYSQNQNTNALRFGTMYNFWFDTNLPPVKSAGLGTLGLFRPYTVSSVAIAGIDRPDLAGIADVDDGTGTGLRDEAVNIGDLIHYLGLFEGGTTVADLDNGSGNGVHDNVVNIDDLLYYLVRFERGA